MNSQSIVHGWFSGWRNEDIDALPLAENFSHTSPFGTIQSKKAYLELVKSNIDKFLGNEITILDAFYEEDRACVRYHLRNLKHGFEMEVSEWFYLEGKLITKIISHYHVGEIPETRKLN